MVDWVVLAAATVGLGVSSVVAVRTGTDALGMDIQNSLSGARVASILFALPGLLPQGWVYPQVICFAEATDSTLRGW